MIYSGLDLGQLQDHTAWVVDDMDDSGDHARHSIITIKKWPINTVYEQIRDDLTRFIIDNKMQNHIMAIEYNVGAYVIDTLFKALPVRVVGVFTAGGAGISSGQGDDMLRVSKAQVLVSCLQSIISSKRLQICDVPWREDLLKELELFQIKISKAGNEQFEAIGRTHDDMVMAACMATWIAEYGGFGGNQYLSMVPAQQMPADKAQRALGTAVVAQADRSNEWAKLSGQPINPMREMIGRALFGQRGTPMEPRAFGTSTGRRRR